MWKLTFEWFDAVDWSWKRGHVYTNDDTREEAEASAVALIRKQGKWRVSTAPYSKSESNPWGTDSLSLEEVERIELPFLVET